MPTLLVVAGPNRCGKSTLTRTSGFSGFEVIDHDSIARSMSPGKATREALRRGRHTLQVQRPFPVETTRAGIGTLRRMENACREDYGIILQYVSLGSPDQELDRNRNRATLGGHDVPEADVLPTNCVLVSMIPEPAGVTGSISFRHRNQAGRSSPFEEQIFRTRRIRPSSDPTAGPIPGICNNCAGLARVRLQAPALRAILHDSSTRKLSPH